MQSNQTIECRSGLNDHNTPIVRRNAFQWMLYGIFSRIFDR